jgi:dTDP-4-dehydrorhamnose 3,5-epimerase-like enzyme
MLYTDILFICKQVFNIDFQIQDHRDNRGFFMMLLHLKTLSLHEDEEEFYMYIHAYMKDNFLYFQMPE